MENSQNPLYQVPPATSQKKLPKDPKIVILIILALIIFILLALTLVTSLIKKKPSGPARPRITPTSAPTPLPTAYQGNIPTQFIEKFKQIENKLQFNPDFPPPQIDPEIGL